jgi:cation diffusion facilitator CzcD-associated flavoprotein CzcO
MVITVDERLVRLPEEVLYKGCMITGMPNAWVTLGYVNASWTLKVSILLFPL